MITELNPTYRFTNFYNPLVRVSAYYGAGKERTCSGETFDRSLPLNLERWGFFNIQVRARQLQCFMTNEKRIRALVIDNEPLARAMIRAMLDTGLLAQTAGHCANGREAIHGIESLSPDVIFLDIELPELDDVDALDGLQSRKRDQAPLVIFVTAFDQHGAALLQTGARAVRLQPGEPRRLRSSRPAGNGHRLPAFDVHALAHPQKPLDRKRLQRAGSRARNRIFDQASERREQKILQLLEELKGPQYIERLVVKAEGRIFLLDVDDIRYIQAEGNYVAVHNGQKQYLLRETISGLEARLDPKKFLRVHRSAIVKIDKIRELQPWFHGEFRIILDGGKQLMLSRNYRVRLQKAIGNAL